MLTFQHQVVYPHGIVVPDQPQRRRAHAAAAQVVPHGKVVQQRRALARQHDLPRIGQPCACVIGQKERLVDAGTASVRRQGNPAAGQSGRGPHIQQQSSV